ncbi:MAG TPA: hypothetical protein PKD32_08040 [Saprospiraceae bacterium]|nr:hypothetical protein [Saprospiraceae bacterium]
MILRIPKTDRNMKTINEFTLRTLFIHFGVMGPIRLRMKYWLEFLRRVIILLSNNSRIDFKYERPILDTPDIYQAYTWQINNFSQTTLDVNYNYKQSALGSNPMIDITFHRKFVKL